MCFHWSSSGCGVRGFIDLEIGNEGERVDVLPEPFFRVFFFFLFVGKACYVMSIFTLSGGALKLCRVQKCRSGLRPLFTPPKIYFLQIKYLLSVGLKVSSENWVTWSLTVILAKLNGQHCIAM